MIGIYKITNKINGKCYIGQSDNIKRRWKNHKKDAFWKNGPCYEYPLYRAIRKYGIENFAFEVIEECEMEQLDEKEIFYISKFNSHMDGYNQTEGGSRAINPIKLSFELAKQIIERLKTSNDTNQKIADDFGVTEFMIRSISYGQSWVMEDEKYPIRPIQVRRPKGSPPQKPIYVKTGKCPLCGNSMWSTSKYCKTCSDKLKGENLRRVKRPSSLELAKMIIESSFVAVGKKFGVSDNAIKKWCQNDGIPTKKTDLVEWYNQNVEPVENAIAQKATYNCKKAVKQIDTKTGSILAVFNSLSEACRAVNGTNTANISRVCNGLQNTAYGYFWQYA